MAWQCSKCGRGIAGGTVCGDCFAKQIVESQKNQIREMVHSINTGVELCYSSLKDRFKHDEPDIIALDEAFERFQDSIATFKVYAEKM